MAQTGQERKPRILLADDDEPFLKAITIILRSAGFLVTAATGGDHAILAHEISLVAKEPFDLLILDIRMPGASGWEVLKHIREHTPAGTRPPRVLLTTGFTIALDLDRVKANGADGILLKPFVLTALVKEVRRVLSIEDPADAGRTPRREAVRRTA
jgi:CheY-like chemotaxis protein